MKKFNGVLKYTAIAAAMLSVGFSAHAGGSLSPTATVFATQNFGSTSTAAMEVVPGVLTYVFSTPGGIVLNNGGVLNMYFRLGNGALFTAVPTTADISGTIATGLGLTKTAVTLSTTDGGTTMVVTFTNSTGGNVTIGVGATAIWTPAAGRAVKNVNTVLNTAGNTVGVTASASVLAANANAVTLPADIDGPAATSVAVATAGSAFTPNVTSSAAFGTPETQKIDVTVSPAQTKFTSGVNSTVTTRVTLGSFKFTDVASVNQLNGTTPYNVANVIAASATSTSAVVTGNFGGAGPGGAVTLSASATCTPALGAGGTAVLSNSNGTATFTGATTAATGVATFVCYTADGTVTIPTTTPSIVATLAPIASTGAATTASGSLYPLTLNGATVDVTSYIPLAATGFANYIRVVNTGSTAAIISAAVVPEATGIPGTSAPLSATPLPAGAAFTFGPAAIEAAIGTQVNTARPRVRITAPTGSLMVQSYLATPGGGITNMSNSQQYTPAASGSVAIPTGN